MAKVTKQLRDMQGKSLERLERVEIARHEERTHVAFLIDESASMGTIEGPTVKAYNEQLKTVRMCGAHDVRSYLTKFNHKVTCCLSNEPIHALHDMKEGWDYKPNGATALYDAIGETCSTMELCEKPKDAFLVVVISDGEDNHSYKWAQDNLSLRISRLKETGRWTFVFIGPEEMKGLMQDIGFDAKNILCVSQNLLPEALEKSAHNLERFLIARNSGLLLPAYFG